MSSPSFKEKAMKEWHLRSRRIDEIVAAEDQFAAWNTLRHRPVEDFGLIVTANSTGNDDDTIGQHTSRLMLGWGRTEDAFAFAELARSMGLPDKIGLAS